MEVKKTRNKKHQANYTTLKILDSSLITLSTIALIFLIVLAPLLFLTFNENYYNSQTKSLGVYERLGEQETKNYNKNTINFLKNQEELSSDFTENEVLHMKDVQQVIRTTKTLFIISILILLLIISGTIYTKNKKILKKSLKYSSITILGITAILIIMTMINFDWTFNLFHNIFFPQGNHSFYLNSLIKTLYPDTFFLHTAMYSFVTTIVLSLIILILTILKFKRKEKTNKN